METTRNPHQTRELVSTRCQKASKPFNRKGDDVYEPQAAGIHMSRPYKLNVKQRKLIAERREKGESLSQIASALDVSTATVWRALQ